MKFATIVAVALFCSSALIALADDASKASEEARVFKLYDTNGDGSISFEEYKTGQGSQMSPARLQKVFAEKDRNHDGKLTLEEFFYVPADQRPAAPSKPDKKSKQ